MPAQTRPPTGTPRSPDSSAVHTGCVATRAVAEATLVKVSDGTQVAKCRASSRPASRVSRRSWALRPRSSARHRSSATGQSTALASALRQKAMASAGTTVAP
jgi:hypothetical protein